MSRFFNTAGPVDPEIHYCLDPLSRCSFDEIRGLIEQRKYFVLHAPRQTGKTSVLKAIERAINDSGMWACCYINLEGAQAFRENIIGSLGAILSELAGRARDTLGDLRVGDWVAKARVQGFQGNDFNACLTEWCRVLEKPLVLLIDEVDSLVGDTLISVLRQIRAGYDKRPRHFPQSIVLCGVRDIRDYRIHSSSEKSIITGGSAFNIKAESIRLGDFTRSDVETLYLQHTVATGQEFLPSAIERVWYLTQGQPWLVNALAYEVCWKLEKDRTRPITSELIDIAKEQLIARRETHLDQLADKLLEERVRRVIEPILAGEDDPTRLPTDDVQYVVDLGLVRTVPQLSIANPIYREVIPRELSWTTQLKISHQTTWYVAPDGRLDMNKLLSAFQQFFRENSESWVERFEYKEAGPHLLLQAFLQRIVNGGGRIEREYALGRGRTDLLILWDYPGGRQRIVIELKVLRRSLEHTISIGLEQTQEYADCTGADSAHLVIFDRTPGKPWDDKIFTRPGVSAEPGKRSITIWGM